MKSLREMLARLAPSRIARIDRRAEELRKRFAPVLFTVPLQADTASYLLRYARGEGCSPETIIAEAVRSYLGNV